MPRVMRAAAPLEKVEQQWGTDTLKLLRFEVFTLGHARRGARCSKCGEAVFSYGTQQTAGVADVFAFTPLRNGGRHLLWWEAKREIGGRSSDDQVKFARLIAEMGCVQVHHVCGAYNDLIAWLVRERWARADQFPHYRQPRSEP
jgi:hypothetical protein